MNMQYNPWPLGRIPRKLRRPELDILKENGYEFDDAREVVNIFENKISDYTSAPYAIAIDCCTNSLFLVLKWFKYSMAIGKIQTTNTITIPSHTYLSVPMAIKQAGFNPEFINKTWSGIYQLAPLELYDAAARFCADMHQPDTTMCLSFQFKKRIPIGRGGMVLTDNLELAEWLRKARYDGRDLNMPYDQDQPLFMGWHMYMTPEDAARGLILFDTITDHGIIDEFPDSMDHNHYTNLAEYEVFK